MYRTGDSEHEITCFYFKKLKKRKQKKKERIGKKYSMSPHNVSTLDDWTSAVVNMSPSTNLK